MVKPDVIEINFWHTVRGKKKLYLSFDCPCDLYQVLKRDAREFLKVSMKSYWLSFIYFSHIFQNAGLIKKRFDKLG